MTNATQTLRIVVADDHPLVLTAISDYLTQAPGCTVVGTADSGARLLDLLRRTPCDLLVTDFSMQGEEIGRAHV